MKRRSMMAFRSEGAFRVSTSHVVTCRYVSSSVFCRFFFRKFRYVFYTKNSRVIIQNEVGGKRNSWFFFGRFIDILMIPETPWLVCLPPASPKSDDPPNIRSGNYVNLVVGSQNQQVCIILAAVFRHGLLDTPWPMSTLRCICTSFCPSIRRCSYFFPT